MPSLSQRSWPEAKLPCLLVPIPYTVASYLYKFISYSVGTGAFPTVVKRPSGGAYDSHLPIAEVKKNKVELYLRSPLTPAWRV